MTPEQSAALLKEFPPEAIGKLPRVTCRACTSANKQTPGTTCAEHRKIKCDECHNWISERHIHLDYVGHAVTTKRLLDVDPEWSWEPFALDGDGLPKMRGQDLWIRLTIGGVTRPGVGDGSSAKEAIGDAIRNAAMRFGVALDLWSKEDLRASDETAEGPTTPESRPPPTPAGSGTGETQAAAASLPASDGAGPSALPASKNRVQQLQSKLSAMIADGVSGVAAERQKRGLPKLDDDCTPEQLNGWADLLNEFDTNLTRPMVPAESLLAGKPDVDGGAVMGRAESKARESKIDPTSCAECGCGPLDAHRPDCSLQPF